MKNCLAPGRWAPENRERLEETIRRNAFQGKYACFDFDDTTSVHAVDHALFAYQVHMLRFAMDPERMREALTTGLDDPDRVLGRNQEGRTVRCGDIVQDLCRDYDLLWRSGAAGAKEEALSAVRQLPDYQDLAAKSTGCGERWTMHFPSKSPIPGAFISSRASHRWRYTAWAGRPLPGPWGRRITEP